MQGVQLLFEGRPTFGRDPIGTAAALRRERLDQAVCLQARERAVKSAGAEAYTGNLLDVLGDRIAVLRALDKAGQDKEPGVIRSLTDVSHCVIVATCHDHVVRLTHILPGPVATLRQAE